MSTFSFVAGTKFMINEDKYVVRKETNGAIELENLNYNKIEVWGKNELLEKWSNDELVFRNEDWSNNEKIFDDFSMLDFESKNEANRRYEILKPVLDGEILPSEIKYYLSSLEPKVGKSAFYEWKSRWDKYGSIRALVKYKAGPKGYNTKEEVVKIIEKIVEDFQYDGPKYTDEYLFSEFILRIDELNEQRDEDKKIKKISRSTFYRRKREIEDQLRKEEIRLGKVETDLRRNGSRKEVVVTRPLQRVEIDWTPVDVFLFNPATLTSQKPWLVYAIDKLSGHPLGFYVTFDDVDAAAVKQCILHAIMPKTYIKTLYPLVENEWVAYGKPVEVVFDNSKVNESFDVKDACQQLGIDIQFCKVGAGYQKGTIERGFRTLNTKWIHTLEGTTFSNIFERGLYDSEGKACITMQTFIYMAHIVMTDIVANTYDKGRGGKPRDLWNRGMADYPILTLPIPQSKKELKLIFMSGIAYRRAKNKGVVIENEYYNSKDLMELRNNLINEAKDESKMEDVRVRFDKADMRSVYVYDKFKKRYIEAKNTGFERKKINAELPVHYSQLQLDSSIKTREQKKDDVTNLARTMRKVKGLAEQDKKKYRKQKRQKQQEQKTGIQKSSSYEGISSMGITELQLESPSDADTIIVHVEEQQNVKKSKKASNKGRKSDETKEKNPIIVDMSYDIDLDSLPDYGVRFKK
ncbi:Mu transposase C-terminal domain-containing protein [Schinkia azotoformans]|uniref:Mu transposase C-terminal domain-containing protein n=1 Tax=Schinkia azotoformans TaxID=1454 RepID=UPI002DC000C1|nr:Mu transposase C-terminal domain-containing protein [Schinkia azotoformans]MEC1718906.1 Mu transposase C-terminal domain-containing protein [Schinkia azotoformans]MED4412882.1 Mu transposase C-terminal domain-containing protein [Schinkia azotoformans]